MKNIILVLLIVFAGLSVQAQEVKKSKNAKVEFQVSGNCEMCKKRIEKAALAVSGVKSAVWNADNQKLHLIVNEEKCSAMDVEKVIAKVGHDTQDIKALQADYDALHTCCQYDRK